MAAFKEEADQKEEHSFVIGEIVISKIECDGNLYEIFTVGSDDIPTNSVRVMDIVSGRRFRFEKDKLRRATFIEIQLFRMERSLARISSRY